MNQKGIYFHHSGKIDFLGLPFLLFVGVIGSICGGFIIGYTCSRSHEIGWVLFQFLNPVVILSSAWGIGNLLGWAGIKVHFRNPKWMRNLGFFFGIFTFYFSWITVYFLHGEVYKIGFNMVTIVQTIKSLVEEGEWSFFLWHIPAHLWEILWTLEVLLLLLVIGYRSQRIIARTAFCEDSLTWMNDFRSIAPLEEIHNPVCFRESLESGDFNPLLNLQKIKSRRGNYTEVNLIGTTANPQFKLITVRSIQKDWNSDGVEEVHEFSVIENIISSRENNILLEKLLLLNSDSR